MVALGHLLGVIFLLEESRLHSNSHRPQGPDALDTPQAYSPEGRQRRTGMDQTKIERAVEVLADDYVRQSSHLDNSQVERTFNARPYGR